MTKLSVITDSFGIPISILIDSGNIHDSKLFFENINNLYVVTNTTGYKNHNRY